MRYFAYTLGDESVPLPEPDPAMFEAMGTLIEEATKSGVLVATGGIGPTSEGVILSRKNGEFTITDGPFTESKELIGGWAIMECRDKDEVIYWCRQFLDIAGDGESRIRPIDQVL